MEKDWEGKAARKGGVKSLGEKLGITEKNNSGPKPEYYTLLYLVKSCFLEVLNRIAIQSKLW